MNDLLEFVLTIPDIGNSGYTWYTMLQLLMENMEQQGVDINKANIRLLNNLFGINEFFYLIGNKREELRAKVISTLQFRDFKKTVGIFGTGNHTRNIIHRYLADRKIEADM